MAILLKKAQGDDQPQVQNLEGCRPHNIAALVDEIGALLPAAECAQKKIKILQASLNPVREKTKTLATLVTADPHHAPNEIFTVEGQQFRATVGKRTKLRAVKDVKRAIELLNATKEDLAYAVVTVPLGKLDSYLTRASVRSARDRLGRSVRVDHEEGGCRPLAEEGCLTPTTR